MWCNRRNAEGLPILPRPGAGAAAPKRPAASTVAAQIPVGKLEEIKKAPEPKKEEVKTSQS